MKRNEQGLIVAGGGTGGHIWAGVAIADAWKEKFGSDARVLFVGAKGGLEEKLVPKAGYSLSLLKLGSLKGVGLVKKARTMLQLPLAFVRSAAILLRERPRVVVGVGGYSSGPLVLTARGIGWTWGARTAILEQNAVPGLTNRVLGRFVHELLSAFPVSESAFPKAKVRVTGNPVRSAMRPLSPAKRDPFTLFIFGGSQGALGINSLVIDSLPYLAEQKSKLRFIHQTGEKDFERVLKAHQTAGFNSRVERFIFDMASAYADASLVICRAGSSTLSELAAVGRAAVLIPFPYAADNHQEKNARIFSEAGCARLLTQSGTTGKQLAEIILEMMAAPERVAEMERKFAQFYRPDAARDVVKALTGSL